MRHEVDAGMGRFDTSIGKLSWYVGMSVVEMKTGRTAVAASPTRLCIV